MMNFDSMNDKKMVSQNIWKLFDVFRGSISTEDYYIILLFIYLRSENLLNQALLDNQNPKSVFNEHYIIEENEENGNIIA